MVKTNSDPQLYSKSITDEAGEILKSSNATRYQDIEALTILSNWRAAHSYPMHIFKKRLNLVSEKIDSKAFSAQRLKRVPSIIKKLKRNYSGNKATMKLTQMQDIAGCRVVMSNLSLVERLYNHYYGSKSDIRHKKVNTKNYINNPKSDGYRSIHLVYRYKSDKKKNAKFNGLLVEVQIRSILQHTWATAVETVGFFTGQAIKSNEGTKEWKQFFKLISAAFAIREGTTPIPNTPSDEQQLFSEIIKSEKELNIIQKLKSWSESVRLFDELASKQKNIHYFLLELDTLQEKLTVTAYSKREEKKAIEQYTQIEQKIFGRKEYDVVLVGTDTFSELKSAYPNYFLDTRAFIKELEKIVGKRED